MEQIKTSTHYWKECTTVQPVWKSLAASYKVTHILIIWPSNFSIGYLSKENAKSPKKKKKGFHTEMFMTTLIIIAKNKNKKTNNNLETTQMSTNRMRKPIVVHSYNRTQLSKKRGGKLVLHTIGWMHLKTLQ